MNKNKMKKGFTLIETAIVLLLIAIVTGIAIVNINSSTEKAVLTTMKADAKTIILEQQRNYAENREYLE